jgi:hypothetical protein
VTKERRLGVGDAGQPRLDALPPLLTDDGIDRAWLRFTDESSIPEAAEEYAWLGFKAGYATALDHVSRLVTAVIESAKVARLDGAVLLIQD